MTTPPIAAAADAILDQCAAACEAVTDAGFCRESAAVRGGSIGKHIRHALDHYRALLECGAGSGVGSGDGCVEYDHRVRGVAIESDRRAALAEISRVRVKIAALGEADMGRAVTIRVMLSGDGQTAEVPTTLGRELWFCAHHAIHHNAMIKAIAREGGVELPEGFGTAPATLNFLRTA